MTRTGRDRVGTRVGTGPRDGEEGDGDRTGPGGDRGGDGTEGWEEGMGTGQDRDVIVAGGGTGCGGGRYGMVRDRRGRDRRRHIPSGQDIWFFWHRCG
jgi:hypothetical protein